MNFKNKNRRTYAFNPHKLSSERFISSCTKHINDYGFCLIDEVIPKSKIKSIRNEILEAKNKINKNIDSIKKLVDSKKYSEKILLKNKKIQLRSVGKIGRPAKPVNDIVWMPKFAKYLASSNIVKVASKVLDDHLRIVQIHPKVIPMSENNKNNFSFGYDSQGLPHIYKGPAYSRDWHTDWPHDPSCYGGDNPDENIGCIRQPFPDITMCLVVMWYLNDVDENSGGTWLVPGSHKDNRTPRGPSDGITLTAPIPGEMQVKAKAGSVFIQDSRLWHSSPLHNFSNFNRVAVVTRWSPWWLSANDFAPKSRFNVVCRPLSQKEYLSLPKQLRPLMKHLCPDVMESIQIPLLKRAKAAIKRTQWAYKQLKKNSQKIINANSKIKIKTNHLKQRYK